MCLVVHKWSQTKYGQRFLMMSRNCSSLYSCSSGWSNWPYTDNNDNSDDSSETHLISSKDFSDSSDQSYRSSDSDDSSKDSSDDSDSSYAYSDYDDDNRFYYNYKYSYVTTHRSCEATACRPPTGKLIISLNT